MSNMRGIDTPVRKRRRRVFKEVANLAFNSTNLKDDMEALPYEIVDYEETEYLESVYRDRAIVREMIRLAMGMSLRQEKRNHPGHLTEGLEESNIDEKYYEPPLMQVIPSACNACPEHHYEITDSCMGCMAHPCQAVCPRGAISMVKGRSVIDQEKCIKCGKCINTCAYHAIIRLERPCAKACGMNAIGSDEYGRADIDQEKCVSCGMCLANCPFGAIADKAQIFQTIQAIKSDVPVYAAIAPAVVGQFGPKLTPDKIRSAFQSLGFTDVVEVAIGADLCTIEEAKDFVEEVPEKLPFMATSCCPAWSMMAKKLFPEYSECISMALTPMVLTGRLIKKQHPGCKVAFIGPCAAKKLEAGRKSIRSDIDFVLTFEEVMGMFQAKEVDFAKLEKQDTMHGASGDGRAFAISGGVANAVVECIKELYPDREVKVANAEGLENCKKLLTMAKAGKYDGYLLEGMACPGGCVAGAGTIQPIIKSAATVKLHKKNSTHAHALESNYKELLEQLEEKKK